VRKANIELLEHVDEFKPDLLLIIGTTGVRAGTLAQARVISPKTVFYCVYPDSPHNLDSDRINTLPFFDRVTTSSPAWVEAFTKLGAIQVNYLPFAADTDLHTPAREDGTFDYNLGFIGTWRPEREKLLEGLADLGLTLWGSNYWKHRTRANSRLRESWSGRSVTGGQFAQICARTKVMLNIVDAATWPGPNMRAFEQPACRAFSLVTRSPALLEIFKEDETVVCFETIEEAREKALYYLEHENQRQRIAEAGYRLIIENGHTYVDRASQLINWAREDGIH
jgi:spore maturation protein CgeB